LPVNAFYWQIGKIKFSAKTHITPNFEMGKLIQNPLFTGSLIPEETSNLSQPRFIGKISLSKTNQIDKKKGPPEFRQPFKSLKFLFDYSATGAPGDFSIIGDVAPDSEA